MSAQLTGITLPSRNLEEALAFYRDVVQFEIYVVQDHAAFLTTGSTPMAICRAGEDSDMDASGHGLFLNVGVDDLDGLKRRLDAFGTVPIREWEEGGETHLLVVDPDQNRDEFECKSQ